MASTRPRLLSAMLALIIVNVAQIQSFKHVYRFQVLAEDKSIFFSCYIFGIAGQAHGEGRLGKFVELTSENSFHVEVDKDNMSSEKQKVLSRLYKYYDKSKSSNKFSFTVWTQLDNILKHGHRVGQSGWGKLTFVEICKPAKKNPTSTKMFYDGIKQENWNLEKDIFKMPEVEAGIKESQIQVANSIMLKPTDSSAKTGTTIASKGNTAAPEKLQGLRPARTSKTIVCNISIRLNSGAASILCTAELLTYAKPLAEATDPTDEVKATWKDFMFLRVRPEADRVTLRSLLEDQGFGPRVGSLEFFLSTEAGKDAIWKRITVADVYYNEQFVFGFTCSYRTKAAKFRVQLADTREGRNVIRANSRYGVCNATVHEFEGKIDLPAEFTEVDWNGKKVKKWVEWWEFFVARQISYHTGGSHGCPKDIKAGAVILSFYYDYPENDFLESWEGQILVDRSSLKAYAAPFSLAYSLAK